MIDCNCMKNIAILCDGEVMNITVGEDVNLALQFAIEEYGVEHGDARDTFGWAVGIGDFFRNSQWVHADGRPCNRIESGEERLNRCVAFVSTYEQIINEMIIPPVTYTTKNEIVKFIAWKVFSGEVSIEAISNDRNLQKAVGDRILEIREEVEMS